MNRIRAFLKKLIGRFIEMETLWMTLGGIFVPVGFSLLAVAYAAPPQPNQMLAWIGLFMGIIGILGIIQAYRLTTKKEKIEDKKFIYTTTLVSSAIDELKTTNSNMVSLLNEIRKERDERNTKPKTPDSKSTE